MTFVASTKTLHDAADLVAAWELVRATGPAAQTFHRVLEAYLIALAKARGDRELFIRFDSRIVNPNWGRWMCFLALAYGKTWRATGRENQHTQEELAQDLRAPKANRGILSKPDVWNDLRVGIIQMSLGPGGVAPWRTADGAAGNLAYVAFDGDSSTDAVRVRNLVEGQRAKMTEAIKPDLQIPQWVFENRGRMSPGHALAYYLCKEPTGPRLPSEAAWPISGCPTRDDFDKMLEVAIERHAEGATSQSQGRKPKDRPVQGPGDEA